MESVHRTLAYMAVMGVAVGVGWAVLTVARRDAPPVGERFQAAVVSLLFVAAASGLIMFAAGGRPADGLHFLYAALAIGIIPLARSFAGRTGGRRGTTLLSLAAFVVLGALVFRLFSTG